MPIHQITQISEQHCGPAVIEMLLEAVGVERTQEEIAAAADIEGTIEEHGSRIDQLAMAVERLAPQSQFWYKFHAQITDIKHLLNKGYAVGVEWQGLFYDSEEDEVKGGDYGHYSIVTFIDDEHQDLIIVDPYKDFSNQNRIFTIEAFTRRWWDTNEIFDPRTHRPKIVTDEQLLFFITPKSENFLPEYGFKRFQLADVVNWYSR